MILPAYTICIMSMAWITKRNDFLKHSKHLTMHKLCIVIELVAICEMSLKILLEKATGQNLQKRVSVLFYTTSSSSTSPMEEKLL